MTSGFDWDAARFFWEVALVVVTAVITTIVSIWTWVRRRHTASTSSIERLEKESKERDAARKADHELHERRILLLENHLLYAPTADDLTRLRETLSGLSGQIKHQEAMTTQLNQTVGRINQYLLERGDKA